MTVVRYIEDHGRFGNHMAFCQWFDKSTLNDGSFNVDLVKKAK